MFCSMLFLILPASAIAKTLGESSFTDQCLREVTSHPLGQSLASPDYGEYVEFCGCLQHRAPKDPQTVELLGHLDRCAVISLSKGNLERYFLILLTTKFELLVYDKIVGRFPAGTLSVASPYGLANRTDCIQKNILSKCSKVHAFAVTYQCIQDVFQTEGLYVEASALCPTLSTDELPLTDHPGANML
ncbi:MAG: hypothetical protein A2X86_03550 [Bdellovibrionales bacterium GWA2_49_15]|nr:MAG: hypothetical protein A2X86_03550 [Bdellovibrionales bacterium GWA2_49_15]HAZ12291.1 hypothetical protein [Bdellovibrionales bacterium]